MNFSGVDINFRNMERLRILKMNEQIKYINKRLLKIDTLKEHKIYSIVATLNDTAKK